MRIAYVVPGYSAEEGEWALPGVQTHVTHAAARHAVEVFSLRWPARRGEFSVGRATVHALGGRRGLGLRVAGFWWRAVAAIVRRHRRQPFDVIHAFWADEPGLVAAIAGRLLGLPVVVSLQGGELVHLADIDYGLRRHRGRAALVDLVLRLASAVTACSAQHAAAARRALPASVARRLEVAPLGVDLARFSLPRPAWRSERRAVNAVGVGSLYPVKNWPMALDVAERTAVPLAIVGDGPMRAALTRAIEDRGLAARVRLAGPAPYVAMPEVYAQADVMLHTSRHETLCVAVLEAAASGVAVVGTPVGVIPELGVIGTSAAALAAEVDALRDPSVRRHRVETARATVERRFGLETVAACHERIYARLMATS